MPKIAIIYHSRSGHTKVVAQHIAAGAEQAGGQVTLFTSAEATTRIDDLNRIGSWLGLMTQSHDDESPAVSPPQSDRLTAEHFGSRIYEVTKQFLHGKNI